MHQRYWSHFAAAALVALSFLVLSSHSALAQQEAAQPAEAPAKPPEPPAKTDPISKSDAKPDDATAGAAAEKSSEADETKSEASQSDKARATSRRPARTASKASADKASADKQSADKQSADKQSADKQSADKQSADKPNADKAGAKKADELKKVEPKKVVRLIELSGHYVDLMQPMEFDASSLIMGGESRKKKSFYHLCTALADISKESEVAYVVFDLSDAGLSMNPAQLDEITRHLAKLKEAGKHTFAWLENPGNVQLALAATCDEVVLTDFGGVDMPSLSMQSMFFRDAMDLVGVQASVVRAGNFKGAVEPYLNAQMSNHLREHYVEMLSAINEAQVDRIARGRGLTVAQVRELQKLRLLLPEQAKQKGLVDRLAVYGSMKETIDDMIGKSLDWTKPKAAQRREMSVFELMGRLMSGEKKASGSTKEGTIVVLHLSGAIEDGKKESPGAIVSGPMVKTIEEISKDEKIKAVVVRINSPGGSATASEAVRRALAALAEKKPTIVSMGEMAASGGYWIACIGQPIYAEKGTITGSIGVFSLKISLGSLMRRVGVHVESIALDDAAKSDAIDRPWSENDMKSMQLFVDDVYEKFLKLVSKSRSIPIDDLQELAGGRVWSGTQAKRHKLIDEIGGLDDCLAALAKKAKLEKYEVLHRPVAKSGIDLLELLGEEDPNEIELRNLLSAPPLRLLFRQGFALETTRTLVRSALEPKSTIPQVWALCPDEISLR